MLDAVEQGQIEGILQGSDISVDTVKGFLSEFGRAFYRVPDEEKEVLTLERGRGSIMEALHGKNALIVVPFRRRMKTWSIEKFCPRENT